MMELRLYRDGDAAGCVAVFHRAVHEGPAAHYDAAEREAWAPAVPPEGAFARFTERLARQIAWVAVDDGAIAGFFTLERDGYLDFAYVAPEHMGTGLSDQLYARLEAAARDLGLGTLTTEASHLARRFFTRQGWQVDARQQVERNGVKLTNFRMSRALD